LNRIGFAGRIARFARGRIECFRKLLITYCILISLARYVHRDGEKERCATEGSYKHVVMRELKRVLWFEGVQFTRFGESRENRIGSGGFVSK